MAKAGIPVRHAIPGVGKNFQDHYIARMSCEVRGIETLNERGRAVSFAGEVLRYLAEDTDRRAMVGGLKFLHRLFAAPSLAKYVVAEKMPGPRVQSDDELLDYARQNGSTVYHASCSCMTGSHAMSVVNSEHKVHGLDALRVIDASIMPAVSSTNTNAPTIMIAEKGAAMIKASARQQLAA